MKINLPKGIQVRDIPKLIEQLQLSEKTYKVYHGTNNKFGKFSLKKATQGIVWFSDSVDEIKSGMAGAQGSSIIMTRYITIKNPAGWDEYEKYSLGQLRGMGYDGVILPDSSAGTNNFIVFDTRNISAKPLPTN